MYLFTNTLLIFLGLLSISKNKPNERNQSILLIFLFLFFVIHDGLRWETGTDWHAYYPHFMESLKGASMSEYGYQLFVMTVRSITSEYTVFLLLHAIIVYSLFINNIKEYSTNVFISIFLFYCLMLPYLGMNRQFIALAIAYYSIRYIQRKQLIKFLILFFLAFLFHFSVLLFLPIIFINNKEIKTRNCIILLSIAFITNLSGVFNQVPTSIFLLFGETIHSKAYIYLEVKDSTAGVSMLFVILGTFKRLIWFILILYYRKKLQNSTKYFNILFNIYFIGIVFYILFNNTSFQIFVARGLLYYNIAEIFMLPLLLFCFKGSWNKLIFYFFIVIYGLLIQTKGLNSYEIEGYDDIFRPYKGVFINTDIKREIY